MDYKNKYLKYKSKYLALKIQVGSGKYDWQMNSLKSSGSKPFMVVNFMKVSDFNIDDYKSILDGHKEQIKTKNVSLRNYTEINFINYLKQNFDPNIPNQLKVLQYFDVPIVKKCSIEELMTLNESHEVCTNFTLVKGSCGEPAFKDTNVDISDYQKTEWLELLNLIKSKMDSSTSPKYLDLVIGATSTLYSDFTDLSNAFRLAITPLPTFNDFEIVKSLISSKADLKNTITTFCMDFPLSHNFPKSKEVLDKILEIHQSGIKVRITNRMCGSCFRSMYYLVQNDVEYKVDPEQGLDAIMDTDEIRKCFK